MATLPFILAPGFRSSYFRSQINAVEPHLLLRGDSATQKLVKMMAQFPEGHLNFTAQQRDEIQELVFFIPYDKQIKYKKALDYLASKVNVRICGRPTDWNMNFADLQVGGELSYTLNGQTMVIAPISYHHIFYCSWKSSTGNPLSLQGQSTREHVTFKTPPSAPPFNHLTTTPQTFTQANHGNGSFCWNTDDHSTKNPAVICANPRVQGELVGEQRYQYTLDDGVTWKDIPGAAYLIKKGVRMTGGQHLFYFSKQNWAPHNTRKFHFEVEYVIGPAPAVMPAHGQLSGASTSDGVNRRLEHFAWKIVSKGDNYGWNPQRSEE